jgi:GT2 family glycosyltransferase
MSAPLVSAIIPHYNDLANLERCLTFLAAQTLPKGEFEVIVAGQQLTVRHRRSPPGLRRFGSRRSGPGSGRWPRAQCRGRSVARPLSRLHRPGLPAAPVWLERGLEALSASDMVGGRVEIEYEDAARPTAVEAFERVFAFNVRRYVEKLGFATTANMFIPREVFDRVGGFRAEGPDDLEWGQRAVAAGYRWRYTPEVVVAHPARRDLAEFTQKWRRLTQMAFDAALERPNGRLRWVLRSFLILGSPLVHWMAVATTFSLETAEQRLGAIDVLLRIRFWRFIEANRLLHEHGRRSGAGPFLRRPF